MRKPYFEIGLSWPQIEVSQISDLAEVTIKLGTHVLTRLAELEQRVTRDFFRASATQLALWFADNWWRLRWETISNPSVPSVNWRLRHELNSASGGALWPPVMIYGAGGRVIFAPSFGQRVDFGPEQYFDIPVGSVLGDEYEGEINRFFDIVINHCAKLSDNEPLTKLVMQLRTEQRDPELAGWRRLEACLGFDPDQVPENVVDALVELELIAGESGVEEAAVAAPGVSAPHVLQSAIDASRSSEVVVKFELAEKIALSTAHRYATPWQLAEDAASELRRVIAVSGGPLLGKRFADLLSIRWEALKSASATARTLPYAARLKKDEQRQQVAMQTMRSRDRRFELARMMGDSIWSASSTFGVTSRARTDRQKFQRAFAQSLLCPFDDLRNHVNTIDPTEEQIEHAAKYYHVHRNVVRSLLVYKGVLPRETLEDQLEAA